MPIRVNLLAEANAAEDLRRRDPVKRAIFGGIFAVVLMLVWSSSLMLKEMMAKNAVSMVQTEIQSHTNDYNVVKANEKKRDDTLRKAKALQQLYANRFLEGNLLNALQQISVPGVQLMRIHVDQTFAMKEGSAGQTNQFGIIPGKPPISTEKISVTMDARDSSANPGDQVNRFKAALSSQGYFQTALNKTNGVRLASLSSPQIGVDGRPYVLFTLECRYPDLTR